jgi:hypothetical protein
VIEDGFYDAGQIRPNTKFMSIEDYCKQELNDKRPVLFINAKAEYEFKSAHSKFYINLCKMAYNISILSSFGCVELL